MKRASLLPTVFLVCTGATVVDTGYGTTDGTLVFSSDREGVHQLFIRDLTGGPARRLLETAREDRRPRWSPDGRRIVFESAGAGTRDLFLVDADGSNLVRLTDSGVESQPDWSTDERVLFTSNRDGESALWAIDIADGRELRLSPPGARDRWPDGSPDGSRIAFSSIVDGDEEIFVMNADGSDRRRLTQRPGEDSRPRWSPDGSFLVYSAASVRTGSSDQLTRVPADGGEARPIEDRAALRKAYIDRNVATWGGVVDARAERIVFTSIRGGNADLYSIDLAGGATRRLTDDPGMDQDPDLRPARSR